MTCSWPQPQREEPQTPAYSLKTLTRHYEGESCDLLLATATARGTPNNGLLSENVNKTLLRVSHVTCSWPQPRREEPRTLAYSLKTLTRHYEGESCDLLLATATARRTPNNGLLSENVNKTLLRVSHVTCSWPQPQPRREEPQTPACSLKTLTRHYEGESCDLLLATATARGTPNNGLLSENINKTL